MVIVDKKNVAIVLMSMLVVNSFVSIPGLGLLCAVVSLYFINSPEYLIPSVFVAAYLDLDCFILGNLTASRYLILLFILFVCIRIFTIGEGHINRNLFLYMGIFLLFIIISSALSYSGITGGVITMVLNILFVIVAGELLVNDVAEIFDILQIGAFEIIVFLFINYFTGAEINSNGSYSLMSGTNNNEVGMALAQIGAIFISSYIIANKKSNRIKKIIQIIGVILSFCLLLLTGSRSATFGLGVAIVISMIYDAFTNKRSIRRSVGTIFSVVLVFAFGFYFIQGNETLLSRFTLEAVSESSGTGRFEIWEKVWEEVIVKHPLFGGGYGEENIKRMLNLNGINHSGTHNILIDMLANMGFVGTLYIFGGLIWLIRTSKDRLKGCPYLFCALVMLFAGIGNGVGENIFSERFLWLDIGMLICMINLTNTEVKYEQ